MKKIEEENIYVRARENAGYSRNAALDSIALDEEMDCNISESTLRRIESNKTIPTPETVLALSKTYHAPELCNYYCTHQCAIGKETVPEVGITDLFQIVITTIDALNDLIANEKTFIKITKDGLITEDEYEDFARITNLLDEVNMTAYALNVWTNKMILGNKIDKEKYLKIKIEKKST